MPGTFRYWRLTTGVEVDFILGNARVAVEAKGKERITSSDYKGLLQFKQEYPEVKQLVIVCLEKQARKTEHGILILPYMMFLKKLWDNEFGLGR